MKKVFLLLTLVLLGSATFSNNDVEKPVRLHAKEVLKTEKEVAIKTVPLNDSCWITTVDPVTGEIHTWYVKDGCRYLKDIKKK